VKPKTLAILAAAVGALALFIAFVERDLPSTDERKASEKKLFRLAAADVTALTVEWNGATVELVRDPRPQPAGGSGRCLRRATRRTRDPSSTPRRCSRKPLSVRVRRGRAARANKCSSTLHIAS